MASLAEGTCEITPVQKQLIKKYIDSTQSGAITSRSILILLFDETIT